MNRLPAGAEPPGRGVGSSDTRRVLVRSFCIGAGAITVVKRSTAVVALAGLVGVAFFLDLGHPDLWDPGEGRYAEAAREMLLTGNWIAPSLNFKDYYDKPPGFYWLVAGAFKVFGTTAWAARLPSAVAAVLTVAATLAFAWRRAEPQVALGAAAILSTTILFVALGRSVRMDMVLALSVSAALFYAYSLWERAHPVCAPSTERLPPETRRAASAMQGRHHRRVRTQDERPTWPLYTLVTLGTLAKGPVAIVLPLLVMVSLAVVTGTRERLHRLRPGPGSVLALGLGSGWYVAAAVYRPEYLWTFLWNHNLRRFVDGSSGHPEPLWFFLWVLPVTFLPWALFLPGALRRAIMRVRHGEQLDVFLMTWFAVVFVFFSLARAKLATYLLPVFPPLAIMVSKYLVEVSRLPHEAHARAFKVPAVIWSYGLALVSIAAALAVGFLYPSYARQGVLLLLLLGFPFAGRMLFRRQRWRTFPALVLVAALATQVLLYRAGSASISDFSSLRTAAVVARELPMQARLFAYRTKSYSFTFYDGRPVEILRSPRAAARILAAPAAAGLITKRKYLERIQQHLDEPAYIWWESASGRVLITNRPRRDGEGTQQARLEPAESTNLGRAGTSQAKTNGGACADPRGRPREFQSITKRGSVDLRTLLRGAVHHAGGPHQEHLHLVKTGPVSTSASGS